MKEQGCHSLKEERVQHSLGGGGEERASSLSEEKAYNELGTKYFGMYLFYLPSSKDSSSAKSSSSST